MSSVPKVKPCLLARSPGLDIATIDPADIHYYQPGWTLVGAGVFDPATTARTMASVLPRGVHWIKSAVAAFEPERDAVILEGCRVVKYKQLVVCPGLKLDWHGIEGLAESLGRNGVTSNYRYDLAPYTWHLVQQLHRGKALFSQPPMPIKCAGAPQKAMYLSADHWKRNGVLGAIDIQFCNAGAVLFGVADYVPALMEYVKAYGIGLNFGQTLVSVDGPGKKAVFSKANADGTQELITREFDMLHAVPPQKAPDFIRVSPLSDGAGWVDVDPGTLRHKQFANIFGLGDVTNTRRARGPGHPEPARGREPVLCQCTCPRGPHQRRRGRQAGAAPRGAAVLRDQRHRRQRARKPGSHRAPAEGRWRRAAPVGSEGAGDGPPEVDRLLAAHQRQGLPDPLPGCFGPDDPRPLVCSR